MPLHRKEPLSDSDHIEDAVLDADGVLNEDTVLDEDVYVCMARLLQSLYVVSIVRVKGVSIVIDMF